MSEHKKSYYAVIPAEVRYDKKLCANAKLLYGEISALTNERGYCWASNSYFANLYDVRTERVSKWIASLKERKYIKVLVSKKSGNLRKISIKPIVENDNTPIVLNDNSYCGKGQDLLPQKTRPIAEKGKHNIKDNTTNNKDSAILQKHFTEFWELYPTNRCRMKQRCKEKFIANCRKAKDPIAEAMRAVKAVKKYLHSDNFEKDNYKFVKLTPTWINQWDLETWLNIKQQTGDDAWIKQMKELEKTGETK